MYLKDGISLLSIILYIKYTHTHIQTDADVKCSSFSQLIPKPISSCLYVHYIPENPIESVSIHLSPYLAQLLDRHTHITFTLTHR